MFLAWHEIKRNKLRFALIIGVLMLIAYLVFFLSGLVNGLANMNREAVDKWQADAIILTEESDKSLPQSRFILADAAINHVQQQAPLAQLNAIATHADLKQGVAIFGIEHDSFIAPNIIEGEMFTTNGEVVAADYLREEGFAIGDTLSLSASDEKLTIVGFTDKARFNAAPVLYTSLNTMHSITAADTINAVVVQSDAITQIQANDELSIIATEDFIKELPGYSAQNITLTLMITFLIIISSVIIAIFLYVLTVQKASMFGVLKAQGISSGYLARSVVAQTFLLAAVAVCISFALTWLTGLALPYKVPVHFDLVQMLRYALLFIIMAIVGAVFSVWSIVRIDPLKAIGG